MATRTVHGGAPKSVRDHHGVFAGKRERSASERFGAARAKVTDLARKHAEAQRTLQAAVDDDSEHYDFRALKSNVHRLARELSAAEEEAEQWANIVAQLDQAARQKRFDTALIEARKAREQFAEHFKATCVALGRWCERGDEIRQLASALTNKFPNGHVYYQPELKTALSEVDANINPMPQLLDSREFDEISTAPTSWLRAVNVVPLVKKGE